jgi:hypothetical protein
MIPWFYAPLCFAFGVLSCAPPEEVLSASARTFETKADIRRLSCRTSGHGLACSGLRNGEAVTYYCSTDSCWWAKSCT